LAGSANFTAMAEDLQQELEQELTLAEKFEQIFSTGDTLAISDFLNDQNISDVADIIYTYPEYESQIISSLSIHRAARVFKIIDLAEQKSIISELPPFKTAELLNELSADDRTDFLEELPSNVVRELIKLLNPEERKTTLSLLGYPRKQRRTPDDT
jgi:magnesium transporter